MDVWKVEEDAGRESDREFDGRGVGRRVDAIGTERCSSWS